MSDIQKQIDETLSGLKSSINQSYYKTRIEAYAVTWLRHQQSIIFEQAKEIEKLREIQRALVLTSFNANNPAGGNETP